MRGKATGKKRLKFSQFSQLEGDELEMKSRIRARGGPRFWGRKTGVLSNKRAPDTDKQPCKD